MKDHKYIRRNCASPHFSRCVIVLMLATAFYDAALNKVRANWETLVDSGSFETPASFDKFWNYNYPWGSDHNGTARMNATNIFVSKGIVTLTSYVTHSDEGNSHSTPHLPIRYNSGTFYLKKQVTICPQFPVWDFRGDFIVPTRLGTWPAFWITGAHSWPPESDFMEYKGSSNCNQNTYNGRWQTKVTLVPEAGTRWHSYCVRATLENSTNVAFQYFIDDVKQSEQIANTFVDSPCWLIIDYQMEGSSGEPGPTNTTYFLVKNIVVKRKNAAN